MFLKVESLSAGYFRDVPIITDITLDVLKGKVTCIIGPNGSGKSTLLKSILNLIPKIKGRVLFDESDITRLETRKIISLGICYVPQDNQLFPTLTVEENIMLAHKSLRIDDRNAEARIEAVLTEMLPDLLRYRKTQVHLLSGGLQKMVAIARGLLLDARLFIMDEPTAGLSPKFASKIYETISSIKEMGKTILLVDQNVKDALSISDHCYVLNNGRVMLGEEASSILRRLHDVVRQWFNT
jgi:branched-chain amino acid transport system ATP-binding protein